MNDLNELLTREDVFELYKSVLHGTATPPLSHAPMDRTNFGDTEYSKHVELIYRWRVEMCLFKRSYVVYDEEGMSHRLILEENGNPARAFFQCNYRVFSGRLPEQSIAHISCFRCLDA